MNCKKFFLVIHRKIEMRRKKSSAIIRSQGQSNTDQVPWKLHSVDKWKELLSMFFLVPIVSAAVESALACEAASMFTAGAATAVSIFPRRRD